MKVPKDIGLKIGTPDEAYWTNVKEMTEMQLKSIKEELNEAKRTIEGLEKSIKLNNGIMEHANRVIALEKEKLK